MPARVVAVPLTHGQSRRGKTSSEFWTWHAMLERTLNPRNNAYKDYGGRGITVCERWLKFENFFADGEE